MFTTNSSYRLIGAACGCSRDSSVWSTDWQELSETFSISLHIGTKYGLLCMHSFCTCCDNTSTREYLFHNQLNDPVVKNMEPPIQGDEIQLSLPYGDVGFFKQKQNEQNDFVSLHDDYVLIQASESLNDCDDSTTNGQ